MSLVQVKVSGRWGKMVLYLLALVVFLLGRLAGVFRRMVLAVRLGWFDDDDAVIPISVKEC